MSSDPGTLGQNVLRLLLASPRSLRDVQAALGTYSSAAVAATVERLRSDGLVQTRFKRLELTRAGRLAAPSPTAQLASQGTYIPPRVVRRAGTEVHSTLPSRVGERRYFRGEA